jgi:O-antigen/teichoic acid export membrane protein
MVQLRANPINALYATGDIAINTGNVSAVRLRDRTLRAGAWTLGGYGLDFVLRIVSNLILSRLLFPEAFGVIAAATALMAGLVLVSDFGIRAVIVQHRRGADTTFLHSAWTFQIWRGLLLWLALDLVCTVLSFAWIKEKIPADSVFHDSSFPWITAALGIILILSGAESTSTALCQRQLNYRPIVILNLANKITVLPVMIICAEIWPSAWSIVIGTLAGAFVRLVLSHVIVPGPPMKIQWSREDVREIIHFGRWIAVSSVATFLSQQCDVILLGVLVPGSVLGLYSIAKLLVNAGEGLLEQLNASLTLPVLGEVLRKDPNSLRERYYRFRLPIDIAAGVFSGCLFVGGSFLVSFLYDSRYVEAGPLLQILALGTLCYSIMLIGSAFTAIGQTFINALISISRSVSLLFCMSLGFFLNGIEGAVVGIAVHRVPPAIILAWISVERNWLSFKKEARVLPSFVLGFLVGKLGIVTTASLGIYNIHQFLPGHGL